MPDLHMLLSHALFEAGAGCGYVLKPEVLINREHRSFDLFNPFRGNTNLTINLEIEVDKSTFDT